MSSTFTRSFFKTQCHVIEEVMQIEFICITHCFNKKSSFYLSKKKAHVKKCFLFLVYKGLDPFFFFFFYFFLFFLTLFPFSFFFLSLLFQVYFFYSFFSASLLHFTAETTHSIMNYNQSNDFWLFKGI